MYLTYSKSLPSFDQHMVHLEFDMPDSSKVYVGFHEGFVALAAKYYEAFYAPVEEVKVEEAVVEVKVVEEVRVVAPVVEEVKVEEEVKIAAPVVDVIADVAPVPVVAPTPVAKKARKANV
jgi:hypothetical protein